MSKIGMIANPASGKDIRRLAAHGLVSTANDKINLILRVLVGLETAGVTEVVMMPDFYGIGREAREKFLGVSGNGLEVRFLDMRLRMDQEDSYRAAVLLGESGVSCVVTLGGDGTNRLVAKGCGDIPILPISSGTNNVFPVVVEGTVAGMAAGLFSMGLVDPSETVSQRKKLEILHGDEVLDIALVDAAVTTDSDIGSKAIWDVGQVRQIVQTCGSLSNIGLSSIGGCVHVVRTQDPEGLSLEVGEGDLRVRAPIAPGLIQEVKVKDVRIIHIGDRVPGLYSPSIIALDGERQIRVRGDDSYAIRLSEQGPRVLEVFDVLRIATELGLFRNQLISRQGAIHDIEDGS